MHVSNANLITQNRMFSGTKQIAGVQLPDFQDDFVYSQKKTGTSESSYRKAIVEQAAKDFAAGEFQMDSQGFRKLMKQYVSEVSPDRKAIITKGLNKAAQTKSTDVLDVVALLFEGEVKYQKSSNVVEYAEFKDSGGELVATYSNGGWTMLYTKAENARQMAMCSIYNEAWSAAKGGGGNAGLTVTDGDADTGNAFDAFA